MGALENRQEYENRIAAAIAALSVKQQRELVTTLGDPPQANNLPPQYWDVYRAQLEEVLEPQLETVYLAYGEQVLNTHDWIGLDWDKFILAAAAFADRRALSTATEMTNTTRDKTVNLLQRDLKPEEFKRRLATLFSPTRAETVAITEVTEAASRSEVEVERQLAAQGMDGTPIWFTREDERVCPICGALHLRKADGIYSDGTPFWIHPRSEIRYTPPPSPHPRCRCHADYRVRNGVLI